MHRPGLLLMAIPAILLGGCGQSPRVDVSAKFEDGEVVFDISHREVNGLLNFKVKDDQGRVLWGLELNYEKGHKIVYGRVPNTGRQNSPPPPAKPPEIRGQTVTVEVHYQYDDWAPSAGTFTKLLQIP